VHELPWEPRGELQLRIGQFVCQCLGDGGCGQFIHRWVVSPDRRRSGTSRYSCAVRLDVVRMRSQGAGRADSYLPEYAVHLA